MDDKGVLRAAVRLTPLLTAVLLAGCLHPVSHGRMAPPPAVSETAPPTGAPGAGPPATSPSIARLPPIDDNPDRLMGMDASAVRAMLGTPRFMRHDKPAQLWRYAAAGCVLELYLYRSDASGEYIVRHLAAHPVRENGAAVSERACLGAVLRARRHGAPG